MNFLWGEHMGKVNFVFWNKRLSLSKTGENEVSVFNENGDILFSENIRNLDKKDCRLFKLTLQIYNAFYCG